MVILIHFILLKEDSSVEHLKLGSHLNMAATHPRWRLKCECNTFFDGVLFVSGMVMYRDEYFVYALPLSEGPIPRGDKIMKSAGDLYKYVAAHFLD